MIVQFTITKKHPKPAAWEVSLGETKTPTWGVLCLERSFQSANTTEPPPRRFGRFMGNSRHHRSPRATSHQPAARSPLRNRESPSFWGRSVPSPCPARPSSSLGSRPPLPAAPVRRSLRSVAVVRPRYHPRHAFSPSPSSSSRSVSASADACESWRVRGSTGILSSSSSFSIAMRLSDFERTRQSEGTE